MTEGSPRSESSSLAVSGSEFSEVCGRGLARRGGAAPLLGARAAPGGEWCARALWCGAQGQHLPSCSSQRHSPLLPPAGPASRMDAQAWSTTAASRAAACTPPRPTLTTSLSPPPAPPFCSVQQQHQQDAEPRSSSVRESLDLDLASLGGAKGTGPRLFCGHVPKVGGAERRDAVPAAGGPAVWLLALGFRTAVLGWPGIPFQPPHPYSPARRR